MTSLQDSRAANDTSLLDSPLLVEAGPARKNVKSRFMAREMRIPNNVEAM